jgi:parallel beta-helix repeat protein
MTASTRLTAAVALLAGVLACASPASAKAPSSAVKCGDTLTHSVKLTRDLTNCSGNGLSIGAPGITVDLNGHTIDGTVTQISDCDVSPRGVAGIDNSGGYDGLTVANGTVQQFFSGLNAGSETTGMSNSTVRGLTARANRFYGITIGSRDGRNDDNRIVDNHTYGNGCGSGIGLNTARGNLVAHNRSHDNGGGILICCSEHNVVRDNLVTHNTDSGITVCCDARDNLIEGNEILDNVNNGIIVFFNAAGTLIRGNHLARNGDNIVLDETSGNTISHNVVTDALGCPFCDPPTGFGIAVVSLSSGNLVAGNLVARSKEDGIRVLDFDPADPGNRVPNGTVVRGNVVRDAGVDGLGVDATAEGTVLERNLAVGAGDDGIQSAAGVLTGNSAFFNHDLGIEAAPAVTDGGGNRARGNGNRLQCVGIACR